MPCPLRSLRPVLVACLVLTSLAGCKQPASGPTIKVKFSKYVIAPDGHTTLAMVVHTEDPGYVEYAQVQVGGLKPGDIVLMQQGSTSWDEPRWMPGNAIVGKVGR